MLKVMCNQIRARDCGMAFLPGWVIRRTLGPLGRTPQDTAENNTWCDRLYQGFALRWMNGWTFGPDDLSNFCAEQNRPAGSAEQGCGFHRFCEAHTSCVISRQFLTPAMADEGDGFFGEIRRRSGKSGGPVPRLSPPQSCSSRRQAAAEKLLS